MPVLLGSDQLESSKLARGRRVGVVCNPASINARFQHIVDVVGALPDVALAAVFGPQHGVRADVQDNMIETPHTRDARRHVPVYSLYSDTREPTSEMLAGLDALVVDLQDVGTRVYTYPYTMTNCLRAARRHGLPVIVCDRPNPIGGKAVEGPVLEAGYESFVGQFPIPLRHGLTIGELASLFNETFQIGADLHVLPLGGWRRSMFFDETGLPWVLPSPNLPTLDSAIVYPGAVLLEGTNLSEGRGTTRPFEIVGAPWIDAETFAAGLNRAGLRGVRFRPGWFEPTFQKHAGQTCGGCQIHVTDRRAFEPIRTAVHLIAEARRAEFTRFAWRDPPYEYESTRPPIDILAGTSRLRLAIDAGQPPDAIVSSWTPALRGFSELRQPYLRYRD